MNAVREDLAELFRSTIADAMREGGDEDGFYAQVGEDLIDGFITWPHTERAAGWRVSTLLAAVADDD